VSRSETNQHLYIEKENVVIVPSPVAAMKAIKNSTEIEGFRQCHIRDGVALARYFAWLERQLYNGAVLNESQGSDKLEEFRSCVMSFTLDSLCLIFCSELDLFRGLSFATISSAGPNAGLSSNSFRRAPDADNALQLSFTITRIQTIVRLLLKTRYPCYRIIVFLY